MHDCGMATYSGILELVYFQADVMTLIQNPGEIVFVPTNWYHQVHNIVSFKFNISFLNFELQHYFKVENTHGGSFLI